MWQLLGILVQGGLTAILLGLAVLVCIRGFGARGAFFAQIFKRDSGGWRIDRLQMIILSLGFLGFYAADALATSVATGSLPEVNQTMLAVLVGSHALYLSGKIFTVR